LRDLRSGLDVKLKDNSKGECTCSAAEGTRHFSKPIEKPLIRRFESFAECRRRNRFAVKDSAPIRVVEWVVRHKVVYIEDTVLFRFSLEPD